MDLQLCCMYLQMCLQRIWRRQRNRALLQLHAGWEDTHHSCVLWPLICTKSSYTISPNQWGDFQAELWQFYFGGSHYHRNVSYCAIVYVVLFVFVLERCVPVILNIKIMCFCPCLCRNVLSCKDYLGEIAKAFHLILGWHICMFFSSVQQILSAKEYFSNGPWALLHQHTNSQCHCDLNKIGK